MYNISNQYFYFGFIEIQKNLKETPDDDHYY